MICPPGKSIFFYKKETEKIELVVRPGSIKKVVTTTLIPIRDLKLSFLNYLNVAALVY